MDSLATPFVSSLVCLRKKYALKRLTKELTKPAQFAHRALEGLPRAKKQNKFVLRKQFQCGLIKKQTKSSAKL
jgi:hypothetical protein